MWQSACGVKLRKRVSDQTCEHDPSTPIRPNSTYRSGLQLQLLTASYHHIR